MNELLRRELAALNAEREAERAAAFEWVASYHEGAHAIAAHHLGGEVQYITNREVSWIPPRDCGPVQCAIVTYAGPVASQYCQGKRGRYLRTFSSHCSSDLERVFLTLKHDERELALDAAIDVVTSKWEFITRLAGYIRPGHTITQSEFLEVIRFP